VFIVKPCWTPGTPVNTPQKRVEWQAWRLDRRRQQQRDRRKRLRRFDYHASPDTAAALEQLWRPRPGYDFSSIIDSIIRSWLTLPPE
jgi:hypothetical protein